MDVCQNVVECLYLHKMFGNQDEDNIQKLVVSSKVQLGRWYEMYLNKDKPQGNWTKCRKIKY